MRTTKERKNERTKEKYVRQAGDATRTNQNRNDTKQNEANERAHISLRLVKYNKAHVSRTHPLNNKYSYLIVLLVYCSAVDFRIENFSHTP